MTHSDAIRQLDAWLFVPVDYEKILPALLALRGTNDYSRYIAKVAEAEFRSTNEIEADVEQCALRQSKIEARSAAIDKKLEAISGVKDRSVSDVFAEDNEDILTGLENRINRKYDAIAQKQEELNNAFKKYTQGYQRKNPPNALVPTCPHCDHALTERVIEKHTNLAIIILAFILFWPIGIVLLLTSKKTFSQQYCPRCGTVHTEHVIH
jgi:hypothetical protein